MLTNLPASEVSVAQLAEVYRARWAVEIQFKRLEAIYQLEQSIESQE